MKLLESLCLRSRLEGSRDRLYRVAYSWCYDPALADDLVQEALTRALQKKHQLRDHERLEVWVYSILNNCWREHLRRRKPNVELDEEQFVCEECPEHNSSRDQLVSKVRSAIAELPVGQRKVVTLVDLEGFTYAEVASILDIPAGTVMSRLSRARQALQGKLADVREQEQPKVQLRRVK